MYTSLIMSILLLANTPVQAEEVAYYNYNEIAKSSKSFAAAGDATGPKYAQVDSTLQAQSQILSQLEYNNAYLENATLQTWTEYNQKRMIGYKYQVSKHVELISQDYDDEFTRAMERALAKINYKGTVEECASAQGIQALMGATPSCQGKSLDKEIAALMDQDPQLQSALAEINNIPWPVSEVTPAAQSTISITGTENYIDVYAFSTYFLQARIAGYKKTMESQIGEIIFDVESGDPEAKKKAEAYRTTYLSKVHADGVLLTNSIETYSAKNASKNPLVASLGYCGNPQNLGGCEGKDVTTELIQSLKADKNWQKSMKKSGL